MEVLVALLAASVASAQASATPILSTAAVPAVSTAAVEVEITMSAVGDMRLSGPVATMVQREIEIQKLAVASAVEGSRDLALQALLIDPCVHSARAAEAFLDDVLHEQRAFLPTFA